MLSDLTLWVPYWVIMFVALGGSILWGLHDPSESSFDIIAAITVIVVVIIARIISLKVSRDREEEEYKKWDASTYSPSAELAINNRTFVNEARAYRATQKISNRKRENAETFTILLLCVAGIIAFLQWRTLEKTDQTWKAGERAFVFARVDKAGWQPAEKIGNQVVRGFFVPIENSGNSPTKDLVVSLYCPRPTAFDVIDPITAKATPTVVSPRLLGPKQLQWAGVCNYTASELQSVRGDKLSLFVAFRADYYDIFDAHHVTEFCQTLMNFIEGDFQQLSFIPNSNFVPCKAHNCADDECKREEKRPYNQP